MVSHLIGAFDSTHASGSPGILNADGWLLDLVEHPLGEDESTPQP
jgi:hypothetical protein